MHETPDAPLIAAAALPWQVESWRLTTFLPLGTRVSSPTWWTELVGAEPETQVSQPRQGVFQAQDSYKAGVLTLNIQGERVNWIYTAKTLTEEVPPREPLSIGVVSETYGDFRDLAHKWLDIAPDMVRLAVGCIMNISAQSRKDAYDILAPYLHAVKLDSENSSDLTYRINRPRGSLSAPGIQMNRLSTWNAITAQIAEMTIPISTGIKQVELFVAARLELDINTAPETSLPSDRDDQRRLFDELGELAIEIAEKGDIS